MEKEQIRRKAEEEKQRLIKEKEELKIRAQKAEEEKRKTELEKETQSLKREEEMKQKIEKSEQKRLGKSTLNLLDISNTDYKITIYNNISLTIDSITIKFPLSNAFRRETLDSP